MKTAKLVAMLLLSIVASFAQSPTASAQSPAALAQSPAASAQTAVDSTFAHLYVGIEGGEMYPFGDLVDAVDNSFYGGVQVRYMYWEDFDGFILFNYSRF